jgi:hypothetical protein
MTRVIMRRLHERYFSLQSFSVAVSIVFSRLHTLEQGKERRNKVTARNEEVGQTSTLKK